MSAITLNTTSVVFPVRQPGQPSDGPQGVGIVVTNTQPVLTSVAIQGPNSSAFTAEIVSKILGHVGLITTTYGASTEIPVSPPGNTDPAYSVQIGFVAPQEPVPGFFSATLVVSWEQGASWPSGSLQVSLQGTTAQISASVTTPQPINLWAGYGATVDVELKYLTVDPAPLEITLTPVQFPEGLTFSPKSMTMTPQTVEEGQNPKGPQQPVLPVLVTKPVSVPLIIKSNLLTTKAGDSTGYAQLQIPYLPGFAPEPGVPIKFNVNPPIMIKCKLNGNVIDIQDNSTQSGALFPPQEPVAS